MSDERTFDRTEAVASATECTGLMPALPADDRQAANDAALYGIHRSGKKKKNCRAPK